MLVTALWNSAWCPIGCRAAWTPCRASGRTRGTGLLKVLYRPKCSGTMLMWELSFPLVELFYFHEPMFLLPTVSYINYGPFTSYAPTYDSSFANISKEESDLIYSSYGDESSPRGSDRYVQRRRTRALWHLHKASRGIPGRLLFQMHPSFTEVTQSGGGQLYTGPHSDWNPSVLTLWPVVYNYLMVCCYRSLMTLWSSIRLCTVCVGNLQSSCVQAEH